MAGWLVMEPWRNRSRCRILVASVTLLGVTLARVGAEPLGDIKLPSPTNVPATLSFAEIREGVLDSIGRIKALDAEFTQLCLFSGPHERAAATSPFTLQRNAFKGDRRFILMRYLEHPYRGNLESDIAAAPGPGEWIHVSNGDIHRYYKPYGFSQAGVNERKNGSCDDQVYARVLSLPIARNLRSLTSEVRAWAGWPPDVYDRPGLRWVVEPMCQSVDGHSCHVISEPTLGRRKWIDPAAGYVERFSETNERGQIWEPAGEDVEWRNWNSDFKEVAAGIWLPFRCRSVAYAVGAVGEHERGTIVRRDDVVAVRLAVNEDVPDALFELRFRPGTVVADDIQDIDYVVGKNGEELDLQSDAGRQLVEGNANFRSTTDIRSSIWLWVNAAGVASLAGLMLIRVLRSRRHATGMR